MTTQLQTLAHRRQLAIVRRADGAAALVSRVLRAQWLYLLRMLREHDRSLAWNIGRAWAQGIPGLLAAAISGRLTDLTDWSARSARWALRGVINGRDGQGFSVWHHGGVWIHPDHRSAALAVPAPTDPRGSTGGLLRGAGLGESHLQEDEGEIIEPTFDWADLFAPWRDWWALPTAGDAATAATAGQDILSLLFLPLDTQQVRQIVYSSGWVDRLASSTRLAIRPEALASTIATGLVLGQDWRAVAKQLEPLVQNVEASARRIARTECLRVAGAAQEATHQKYVGDLIIGWQVHATLDKNTRTWHRDRDKAIYYVDPKEGQKGMEQCPHPPEEAADPAERPVGTPQVAPNCRCYLTPVLRPSPTAAPQ